jgi:hypothetical protein
MKPLYVELDEAALESLDKLKKGRSRSALIRRVIEIASNLGVDAIWPEDKQVRDALAAIASKARRVS